MRPALYWVIRFDGLGYGLPCSMPGDVFTTRRLSSAFRWRDRQDARARCDVYLAAGHPCRVVRVVRKETAK